MSSSSQDKVVCVHAHGHPKNPCPNRGDHGSPGRPGLAWNWTARLRPLCQVPGSEYPHMLRSGWGVWRKPFLWQGGLPFPHSSWKGGTRSGWRKRMAGLAALACQAAFPGFRLLQACTVGHSESKQNFREAECPCLLQAPHRQSSPLTLRTTYCWLMV